MKPQTLHSLLISRSLYDEANKLIELDDRYMSSAGLLMLQDALEIIFLAVLIEKDVDKKEALENKNFDSLIKELK